MTQVHEKARKAHALCELGDGLRELIALLLVRDAVDEAVEEQEWEFKSYTNLSPPVPSHHTVLVQALVATGMRGLCWH